jgi:hypothetical protein
LNAYIGRLPEAAAAERVKVTGPAAEALHFAWAGSTEPRRPHYYRIQGPLLLAEYDNTARDANHIHTVWRDPSGDFGRDVLAQHYATATDSPQAPQPAAAPSGHQENLMPSTQPRTDRPAGAPAYYLGRPASLWIAATRQRHWAARTPRPTDGPPAAGAPAVDPGQALRQATGGPGRSPGRPAERRDAPDRACRGNSDSG